MEARRRRVVFALASLGVALLALGSEPNIVVEGNKIAENGLGIYLGWTGNWYIQVIGNEITGNGEGLRVVNRRALIEGNVFARNVIGIRVTEEHEERKVTDVHEVLLRGNVFEQNELYAVQNLTEVPLRAEGNSWGTPTAPSDPGGGATRGVWAGWGITASLADCLACGLSLTVSLTMAPWSGMEVSFAAVSWGVSSSLRTTRGVSLLPKTLTIIILGARRAPELLSNLVVGPLSGEDWVPRAPMGGGE